jgi:N4-gp56 family major capsid protein
LVLNEATARLGVSMRQTEDQLTRDMLASTASFINCTGGFDGDNPTEITRSDVANVTRTLLNNNAYTILSMIGGENKFGTAPIRNSYFAMCSSNLIGDLENVSGFTHASQYPSLQPVQPYEWGAIGNLRFFISSIGSVIPNSSALGADVYNIFCAGMESYACIQQMNYAESFIYRPPIYSDPLAQNITVAYKFGEVPRLLNDLWLIRLRATLAS